MGDRNCVTSSAFIVVIFLDSGSRDSLLDGVQKTDAELVREMRGLPWEPVPEDSSDAPVPMAGVLPVISASDVSPVVPEREQKKPGTFM